MGKKVKNQYDPQIGAAAAQNAAIAQQSLDFNKEYFEKYVTPLLAQQSQLATQANDRETEMFNLNKTQMQTQLDRYNKYGIPAEDAYYNMVKNYSSEEEQAKQAEYAIGDIRTGMAAQQGNITRRMTGLGIDPSSPAAQAVMADMGIQQGAMEAAAANRARDSAKAMGMQLTSDAANFGRGGTSNVLAFGQAASGNNLNGLNAVGSALQGANSGSAGMNTGFGLGLQGYGNNLSAYTSLGRTSMEASAQASTGLGNLLGQGLSAYLGKR